MTSITRTRLRCNEKDCPRRDDEKFHRPVCWKIKGDVVHSDEAQHQHWPKRSQGGKAVVAVICSYCHFKIDSGPWGNAVEDGVYRIWDVHGNTLLRASTAEGEAQHEGGLTVPSSVAEPSTGTEASLSAADVRGPTGEGSERQTDAQASGKPTMSSPAGASSDGARESVSSRSPEAGPPDEVGGSVSAPSPDAGADSRGALSKRHSRGGAISPAAVTRSSVPDLLGGDGIVDAPPVFQAPSPPISESLKPNGLDLPSEFTFEEWTSLMDMIEGMDENSPWWWGDAINKGERFGERCWQNIKTRRRSYETLMNYRRVAESIPRPLRRGNLSFSLHAVFYACDNITEWLDRCEAQNWTVKQAREAVHGVKPRTVRYTLSELREALAAWPGERAVRNNGRKTCEAFLDSLEAR